MRNTGRTENSVFYYDDTDSDTETGEKDADDIHEKTVVSQEVSLLGKRYRDTSLQVQGDRERQNQPQMGVRARREVVDWLVFKTDKGERPAVSWDKIKDIDQDAYKVDIINNNIVTSDTFEDINKNEIHKTTTNGDSIQMYNQFEEHTNLDFNSNIPIDSNSSDQNANTINLTEEQNNNITEDTDNTEDTKTIVIANDNDETFPAGDFHNFSLFSCSQDCFNIDSDCHHQRVVLPVFQSHQ